MNSSVTTVGTDLTILLLLFGMSSLVIAIEPAPILASEAVALLTLEEAPGIFRQCSRKAPKVPKAALWIPSSAQIKELENGLPAFVAAATARDSSAAPHASGNYARQYVGYTLKRRRYIYGSFFPVDVLKEAGPPWKGAIIICDGGPAIWGVVYDLQRKAFMQLQINGS
ncbi:hypothetical protein [Roseateles sp.]|uniref:hypothetical protein n=1 Tax=Roseateles sp. TaxID=1971397 RepID=UPI003263D4D0